MGEIVIEEVNYKAYIILFTNLVLLISTELVTAFGFKNHRPSYWLPGMIVTGVLFVSFIGSLVRVFKVKKLLTITRDGIIDNSAIGGVGLILFDDIREFTIVSVYNKKAIAVIPKNVDNFLSQLSRVKRSFVKRNLSLNLPPVVIYVNRAKDIEPEDILSLLRKRLADISSLDD